MTSESDTKEEAMKEKGRAVLVTTSHRGVFFGWLNNGQDETNRSLALTDCRNVIHWTGKRGFLGLASHGPEDDSQLGSTASRVLLHDIVSVTDCSDAATKALEGWS